MATSYPPRRNFSSASFAVRAESTSYPSWRRISSSVITRCGSSSIIRIRSGIVWRRVPPSTFESLMEPIDQKTAEGNRTKRLIEAAGGRRENRLSKVNHMHQPKCLKKRKSPLPFHFSPSVESGLSTAVEITLQEG